MKTLKIIATIALFGLISLSNFAQTDENPKAMFASYESHRKPEVRNFERPADAAEASFLREAFEIKMAELQVERINYHIEKSIKYVAPSVELIEATEELDSLMAEAQDELKYIAPEN
jgi:hypothetical protein